MIKVGWHITFADRVGVIVYSEDKAREIVRGDYDPYSFAPGTAVDVEKVTTKWVGDHDDNTRTYYELSRVSVPLDHLREGR